MSLKEVRLVDTADEDVFAQLETDLSAIETDVEAAVTAVGSSNTKLDTLHTDVAAVETAVAAVETDVEALAILVGEVHASPTENTVLERLKAVETAVAAAETDIEALATLTGEVQATPTANTLLGRLKDIEDAVEALEVDADGSLIVQGKPDPDEYLLAYGNTFSATGNVLNGSGYIYVHSLMVSVDADDMEIIIRFGTAADAEETLLRGYFMQGGGANIDLPAPVRGGSAEPLYLQIVSGTGNVMVSVRYVRG